MILDNEKQRENLLAMIATATLAGGTKEQLRQGIIELDELEDAVKEAKIEEKDK